METTQLEPDTASPAAECKHPSKGKAPARCPDLKDESASAVDTCVICLSPLSERAVATPCNHLVFDFLCLVSWLQENPTCPLCKATVTSVQYDWCAPDDYKTYVVPVANEEKKAGTASGARNAGHAARSRDPGSRGRSTRRSPIGWGESARSGNAATTANATALARRRLVYEIKCPSLHVGANRHSEYKDFTPASFMANPPLQSRARIFIRRELQVFSFLQTQSRLEFLLEYVVGMLKKLDIKGADGAMEGLVAEFLGRENARLFVHELEAWLRSPYAKLEDWDRKVQYDHSAMRSGKSATFDRGLRP